MWQARGEPPLPDSKEATKQQGRADGARSPDHAGVEVKRPAFVRAGLAAVRRFFADRFRSSPSSRGLSGQVASPSRLGPPDAGPRHVAAPPVAPTTSCALFDTRLAKELRRLLTTLGASRGSVASTLEAAGVRAAPKDPLHPPLALFLTAVIGADPNVKSVRVQPDAVVVDLRAWWRPPVTVFLPPVARDFSIAFDAGCYPALLRDDCRPDGADHAHGPDTERGE